MALSRTVSEINGDICKKFSRLLYNYILAPTGWPGHNALMTVVCLSVPCLSLKEPKTRMEGRSKLKIGRKEAMTWAKRSKIKVTRPLNAVTENQPHLQNGKAYDLQTSCNDTHHQHARDDVN